MTGIDLRILHILKDLILHNHPCTKYSYWAYSLMRKLRQGVAKQLTYGHTATGTHQSHPRYNTASFSYPTFPFLYTFIEYVPKNLILLLS